MTDQSYARAHDSSITRHEFFAQWNVVRAQSSIQEGQQLSLKDGGLTVSPYPGLRSFRPDEADLFFGRDAQVRELRKFLTKHNVIFVLGGSGSGKSSLVRAGLIPELNSTSPIPGRAGAWYVVEFRPKLDPSAELFDALFEQIVSPVLRFHLPDAAESASSDREAVEFDRRVGALDTALAVSSDPNDELETITKSYESKLREMLFEGDVVDVGALFDFVDQTLLGLDRALSEGMIADAPNLLILIDQFEEVFKPKVETAARAMLMDLITSVHTYKPFNLFLVVTMRSEELHRCAEFIGLADVVNKSFYLVDLIGGKDIERAIVGPAQRLLGSWGLEVGDGETGPFTTEALSRLHRVFDAARDELAHPADQLPLMQHLLPLIWEKAVQRWQAIADRQPLSIDLRDCESIPGWSAPEGVLLGTLNATADAVLSAAIRRGASSSGLPESIVGQLLRVSFCCLAQLDDNGKVVRDFASLDQMLNASGAFERLDAAGKVACKVALESAFEVFREATLVNTSRVYDVNHEALTRGWVTYAGWIEDARDRAAKLVSVDQQIQAAEPPAKKSLLLGWIDAVSEWIFVEKLAKADQIAGDETSRTLEDVVGISSVFSDEWACMMLDRADGKIAVKRNCGESGSRLGAIRSTIEDAKTYRDGAKHRPRLLLLGVVMALTILSITGYGLQSARVASEKLNNVYRFSQLQEAATLVSQNNPRSLAADRELYAVLAMEGHLTDNLPSDEAKEQLYNSMRSLEDGARVILSDVSIRVAPNRSPALPALNPRSSKCAIVNPSDESHADLIGEGQNLGVRLKRADVSNGVSTITMIPVWRSIENVVSPIESSNLSGFTLLPGSLVCLSNDANWLLIWTPAPGNQSSSPPNMYRIVWIRTAPLAARRDNKWHVVLQSQRRPSTSQSFDVLINKLNPEVTDLIQAGGRQVLSFRSGDRVGFLLPLKSRETAILWTSAAVSDADPVDGAVSRNCTPTPIKIGDRESRELFTCNMGEFAFEGQNHRLEAAYFSDQAKYIPQVMSGAGQGAGGQRVCSTPNDLCATELRISFNPSGQPSSNWLRMSISHFSSGVVGAQVKDGYLLVSDANGQTWRYSVGTKNLLPLLQARWQGLSPDAVKGSEFSQLCKRMKCDETNIPEWPGSN